MYRSKIAFAKEKDLDKRYTTIYEEKIEQYWRFTNQDPKDEADDSNAESSEEEEEEEKDEKEEKDKNQPDEQLKPDENAANI